MPAAGDTFRGNGNGTHLYVVLTSPTTVDEKFVIVNLTTKYNRRGEDHTCILLNGEHPFITHDTVVYYSGAYITDAAAFRGLLSQAQLVYCEAASAELLKKIQEGALISRFTPGKIKKAVKAELERGG